MDMLIDVMCSIYLILTVAYMIININISSLVRVKHGRKIRLQNFDN